MSTEARERFGEDEYPNRRAALEIGMRACHVVHCLDSPWLEGRHGGQCHANVQGYANVQLWSDLPNTVASMRLEPTRSSARATPPTPTTKRGSRATTRWAPVHVPLVGPQRRAATCPGVQMHVPVAQQA